MTTDSKLLVGHAVNHAVPEEAGGCDGDMQAAETLDREGREALADVGVGDGRGEPGGGAARLADETQRLVQRRLIEVVGDDARALFRQPEGDALPDAASSPGYDGHAACDAFHHCAWSPLIGSRWGLLYSAAPRAGPPDAPRPFKRGIIWPHLLLARRGRMRPIRGRNGAVLRPIWGEMMPQWSHSAGGVRSAVGFERGIIGTA